jgi:DNA-binding PadR family transcriptional regulator
VYTEALKQKQISGQLNKILSKLVDDELIERTIPNNINQPDQKFRITKRGLVFLDLLKNEF